MLDMATVFGDDMHATLRQYAAEGPTDVDDVTGATIVFRYEDIDRLARDRRLAGVGLTFFDLMGITDGPLRDWYGGLMFTNEGAAHNRLRALVSRAFTPRAVEALRTDAAMLVAEAMATIDVDGGGDLVRLFSRIPIRVMCRLLGVPEHDVPVFATWADALSRDLRVDGRRPDRRGDRRNRRDARLRPPRSPTSGATTPARISSLRSWRPSRTARGSRTTSSLQWWPT